MLGEEEAVDKTDPAAGPGVTCGAAATEDFWGFEFECESPSASTSDIIFHPFAMISE